MKHHFFESMESLNQFTMELDRHQDSLVCKQCSKSDQFISHGYVYRQLTQKTRITVGKRLFCSNRHGRSGCGSTLRLYLAFIIPVLRYDATHLMAFLNALINGMSIQKAYQAATQTDEPRNAYRWLDKLHDQLINYHGFLKTRAQELVTSFRSRTRRLQILLPTIQRLATITPSNLCRSYQLECQTCFI
jgi:hypothetical protein